MIAGGREMYVVMHNSTCTWSYYGEPLLYITTLTLELIATNAMLHPLTSQQCSTHYHTTTNEGAYPYTLQRTRMMSKLITCGRGNFISGRSSRNSFSTYFALMYCSFSSLQVTWAGEESHHSYTVVVSGTCTFVVLLPLITKLLDHYLPCPLILDIGL